MKTPKEAIDLQNLIKCMSHNKTEKQKEEKEEYIYIVTKYKFYIWYRTASPYFLKQLILILIFN